MSIFIYIKFNKVTFLFVLVKYMKPIKFFVNKPNQPISANKRFTH